MSPEVISVIAAIIGAVATIFGGMYVMLRRGENRTDARFARIDARFDKQDEEMRLMRADIVDLKVSVARLEGHPPTLLRTRA